MKTLRNILQRFTDRSETVIQLTINIGITAIFLIIFGAIWDTLVHIQSHHKTFAPAHLLIMGNAAAFSVCFAVTGFMLRTRKDIHPKDRRSLWIVAGGTATVLFGLIVFDELIWHTLLGRGLKGDQSSWSPPHLVFLAGMIVAMYGIASIAKRRAERSFLGKVQLFLSVSAMYFVGFIIFLEYDASDGISILQDRPGWFYPIVATVWFVLTTLFAASFFKRTEVLVLAAGFAWLSWSGVVTVVETLSGVDFTFFPYPVVIPALTVTLCYRLGGLKPQRVAHLCATALFASTACYWGLVAWAAWITKVPQQITGQSGDWALWFVAFAIPAALIIGIAVHLATRFSTRT